MRNLWPEGSFMDVFDSEVWSDECPKDKYGLWQGYGDGSYLNRLGIHTPELLHLHDPGEHERIKHHAARWYREWQRRNPKDVLCIAPNLTGISEEREKTYLEGAGLTIEQAKRLVAEKTR